MCVSPVSRQSLHDWQGCAIVPAGAVELILGELGKRQASLEVFNGFIRDGDGKGLDVRHDCSS
jgi:hypothetical protein